VTLTGTAIRFSTPAVMLYGNDSRVDLQVFRLNADKSAGSLVGHLTGDSCTKDPLTIPLDKSAFYLVRVAGDPGSYTLQNNVTTSSRRHPLEQRDRVYEVLHPGEPVESLVHYPEVYVIPADRAITGVVSDDPRIHLRLLDAAGRVISEGSPSGTGERISFARAGDATTLLEATRRDGLREPPTLRLAWQGAQPKRSTEQRSASPAAVRTAAGRSSNGR
jgi:hypothetical protein